MCRARVIAAILDGATSAQVAAALGISLRSVQRHAASAEAREALERRRAALLGAPPPVRVQAVQAAPVRDDDVLVDLGLVA